MTFDDFGLIKYKNFLFDESGGELYFSDLEEVKQFCDYTLSNISENNIAIFIRFIDNKDFVAIKKFTESKFTNEAEAYANGMLFGYNRMIEKNNKILYFYGNEEDNLFSQIDNDFCLKYYSLIIEEQEGYFKIM